MECGCCPCLRGCSFGPTDREKELLDALVRFGRHDTGCPGWFRVEVVGFENDERPCDCGLDEAKGVKP